MDDEKRDEDQDQSLPNPKLFVGGLAWAATDDDLRLAFEPFGKIVEAIVVRYPDTGRSKGFGFVTYTTTEEAKKALAETDGKEIAGRAIKVSFARAKKVVEENRTAEEE